jgi:hypothetical protein
MIAEGDVEGIMERPGDEISQLKWYAWESDCLGTFVSFILLTTI